MNKECSISGKVANVFIVKKGMAEKAFWKNVKEGNNKKLHAQIKKGTVRVLQ